MDVEWEQLDDSAAAATSVLNKGFREAGKTAQASAVATGKPNYTVQLPDLKSIDGVTAVFGDEEATAGKPKKVYSATLVFGAPVVAGASAGVGCGEDTDCM